MKVVLTNGKSFNTQEMVNRILVRLSDVEEKFSHNNAIKAYKEKQQEKDNGGCIKHNGRIGR